MGIIRLIFLVSVLFANFLFTNLPGIKIIVYAYIVFLILNFIYKRKVEKYVKPVRLSKDYRLFNGFPESIELDIVNGSILPIHAVMIRDYSDLSVSKTQSHPFVISIQGKGTKSIRYPIIGRKRGRYIIGPTRIFFSDLIGLYSFENKADAARDVIVFPNILRMENVNFKNLQPQGFMKNKAPIFENPAIFTGLREYKTGDETRRINWKAAAKHNELMVNTYQHSISSRNMILLNLYEGDYEFKNKYDILESGIETACALLRHFFILKQEFSFASNCHIDDVDKIVLTDTGRSGDHFTSLLTHLAVMEFNTNFKIDDVFEKVKLNLTWGTSLFVLTPVLNDTSILALAEIKKSSGIHIINIGREIKKELGLWDIGFQSYFTRIHDNSVHFLRVG